MQSAVKRIFSLYRNHSDRELCELIASESRAGWLFDSLKGNSFVFKRSNGQNAREITVRTFSKSKKTDLMPEEVAAECVRIREKGWDTLFISDRETVFDMRRHIFLVKERPDAADLPFDDAQEKKALSRGRRKILSSICLCLFFIAFLIIVFSADFIRVLSDYSFFTGYAVFVLSVIFLLFFSLSALRRSFVHPDKYNHLLDASSFALFVFILLCFAFLVVSPFFHKGSRPLRTMRMDAGAVKIYDDAVPFALEDFSLPADGAYRSSRLQESAGFFGSFTSIYDSSFDVITREAYGTGNLKMGNFISVSVFRSRFHSVLESARSFFYRQIKPSASYSSVFLKDNCCVFVKCSQPLSQEEVFSVVMKI